jgi:hypothetical protein
MKVTVFFRSILVIVGITLSSLSMAYELTIQHKGKQYKLPQEGLTELPLETLSTITPWTDQSHTYQGISLKHLLEHFKIQGHQATAKAMNNYQVTIEITDAIEKGAFIASKQNDKPMKVRNKGPFWIIFPWSQKPELVQKKYQDWSIWQMSDLTID